MLDSMALYPHRVPPISDLSLNYSMTTAVTHSTSVDMSAARVSYICLSSDAIKSDTLLRNDDVSRKDVNKRQRVIAQNVFRHVKSKLKIFWPARVHN